MADKIIQPASSVQREDRRVLCVDDDEALMFLVSRGLKARGFRVTGYTNPHHAIAAVKSDPNQFDFVVTDHDIVPGYSGIDVAMAVRQARENLPVVLMSGYLDDARRARAFAAGIHGVFYKPTFVEELISAMVRHINELTK